ncbi:MAG: hypothetical protein WD009_12445 [Phycisphaeraceae bacterium]
MTKQQKILAAVLALGACAVVVDQAWLGGGVSGPGSAAAGAGDPVGGDAGADAQTSAGRVAGEALALGAVDLGPTLAEQLSELAAGQHATITGSGSDAFSPSEAWVGRDIQQATAPETEAQAAARMFVERRPLRAVMGTGARGMVNVGGEVVAVGQQVEGFTLDHVAQKSAVFVDAAGNELTLTLD